MGLLGKVSLTSFVNDYSPVDSTNAEIELEEICSYLKKANIRHWLSSGTMLGVYRDGKFLDGDTDIDIGVMAVDIHNIRERIDKKYELTITRENRFFNLQT